MPSEEMIMMTPSGCRFSACESQAMDREGEGRGERQRETETETDRQRQRSREAGTDRQR